MNLSKLSISSTALTGFTARIRYSPYALFDIGPQGVKRWNGMSSDHVDADFIGSNGAIRVLRSFCEIYPQNYMDYSEDVADIAHKNLVVHDHDTNVDLFIYVYEDVPYVMSKCHCPEYSAVQFCTILRITNNGLERCRYCSTHTGVGLDVNEAPLIWRVK